MAHSNGDRLDRYFAFRSRFHVLCITGFYIGLAMLASSLLEAHAVWQAVAERFDRPGRLTAEGMLGR